MGTTEHRWGFAEAVAGYARFGIRAITPRRGAVDDIGVKEARRLLDDHGMTAVGLSRLDSLTAELAVALEDGRRAIEMANRLGAAHVVCIAGGLPAGSKDLAAAYGRVAEALGQLAPEAAAAGVRLGLEPIHPMRAGDRGCVNTLDHALDLCEAVGGDVGVVVDTYHLWWDPDLDRAPARAAGRILAFQISDWLRETVALDADRGMPGEGVIDLHGFRQRVRAGGYDGFDEIEVFSARTWWQRDPEDGVRAAIDGYRQAVLRPGPGT